MLTALDLEYQAIRRHVTALRMHRHQAGTLYEVGLLPGGVGRVVIAVTGEGNRGAAVLTERAISEFRPAALLYVGVAGALRDDIHLGDVVVATKVYSYHGGKDTDEGFLVRPAAWAAPHALEQIARHIARNSPWHGLLPPERQQHPPTVHLKPIAAGEVLLNSRTTPLAQQLRYNYNDAVAIEMESAGVAHAGHLNSALPVLTVRGISDRADGAKHADDAAGWQSVAAANAAAFAIALAVDLLGTQAPPTVTAGLAPQTDPVATTRPPSVDPREVASDSVEPDSLAWARDPRVLPLAGIAVMLATLANAGAVIDAGALISAGYYLIRFSLFFVALWLITRLGNPGAAGRGIALACAVFLLADAASSVHSGAALGWLELFVAVGFVGLLMLRLWPFPLLPHHLRVVPPTRRPLAYAVLGAAGAQTILLFVPMRDQYSFMDPFTIAGEVGLPAALLAVIPLAGLCAAAALTDLAGPTRVLVIAAACAYFGPELYFLLASLLLGPLLEPSFTYLGVNYWGQNLAVSWFVLLQIIAISVTAAATILLLRPRRQTHRPPGRDRLADDIR